VEHAVHTSGCAVLSQDESVDVVARNICLQSLRKSSSLVGRSEGVADTGADAGVVGLVVVGAADVGGGVVDGGGESVGRVEERQRGGDGVD